MATLEVVRARTGWVRPRAMNVDHLPMAGRALSILYVGTLPPHQGGSALFAAEILPALAKRGHEIRAISAITEAGLRDGDSFAQTHPQLMVTRYVLPYFNIGTDVPPPAEYWRKEGELIGEFVALALQRARPDVVIAGRELVAPHLDGVSHLPRLLVAHGTTTWGLDRGRWPPELAERLLTSLRRFDLIVTSGHHAARDLAELGVPGAQVISNPVDLDRFRPLKQADGFRRELNIGSDEVVVLHASKLNHQKRPMDILGAAEIALRTNERLLFVVAGNGAQREQLESECHSRQLENRFRFPGWIAHERMPELMNASHMFVMPSAYECQALVYLESMACGRPLIASDIPAAREVVQDGISGLLHPEGDEHALAAAILACAGDSALRDRLAAGGLAEARRHALPTIAEAYERALGGLVTQAEA